MGKIKLRTPPPTRAERMRAALDNYGRSPDFVYHIDHRTPATTPEDLALGERVRAAVELVIAALRWSMDGVTWHTMDTTTAPSTFAPEFAPLVCAALAEIGCAPCHISYYGDKSFRASFHEDDWRERITLSITVRPDGVGASRQVWRDNDWLYVAAPDG